jgi:hypothetical protein
MQPWKEILENGQLRTWAPPNNKKLRHIYSNPVGDILRCLDGIYWKLKWSKKFGVLILLSEFLLSRTIKSITPSVVTPEISYTKGDVLINLPDLYFLSSLKSLTMHKYAMSSQKDFVVFTTTSSYVNLKLLEKFLFDLPRRKLVAGRVVHSGNKKFISGSFRIYTPDVLRDIDRQRMHYKSWLAEDLAMGILLESSGYELIDVPSLDIASLSELNLISDSKIENTVHFRLKSGTDKNRNDSIIMHELHKRLIKLGAV